MITSVYYELGASGRTYPIGDRFKLDHYLRRLKQHAEANGADVLLIGEEHYVFPCSSLNLLKN